LQFARRMAVKGQGNIRRAYSLAIVRHFDRPASSVHDIDDNPRTACIEAVIDQLFDDGSRPLDDFSSRNTARDLTGQHVNFSETQVNAHTIEVQ
jgi:hypothetical protein